MDEDRRRKERAARAEEGDPEAYVREALAHRRSGQLDASRTALERAIEVSPRHELARALLLLTEVALGRRTRGSFGEARLHSVDLTRFLDAGSMRLIARSALDPSHGPIDAEAVEALVEMGKEGALAVLDALADADVALVPDRLRIAIGLRARVIAAAGIRPEEVNEVLRARIAAGVVSDAEDRAERAAAADWFLLAGAIHMAEMRPHLERALDREPPALRYAAAVALELLGDPAALPALRRALGHAKTRGDRIVLERAIEALES